MRNPFRLRKPPALVERKMFDLTDLQHRPRLQNEAAIRALCSQVYVGDSSALCRVLGRYKMYVDTRDISVSAHLLLDGYWEMWLTEELVKVVQPGMRVVDVGANLGYFTVLCADLVGGEGHVHAFEPNPDLRARLRKSLLVNGFGARVTLHEEPLGDREGAELVLSWDPEQSGGGYVHGGDHPEQTGKLTLASRRMDGFDALAEADIIKIDAEAAEQAIWRGASGILARERPMTVFMEFTACRYPDAGGFLDEISAHGFGLGYISMDAGLRPGTKAEILALPAFEDQMLVLTRG